MLSGSLEWNSIKKTIITESVPFEPHWLKIEQFCQMFEIINRWKQPEKFEIWLRVFRTTKIIKEERCIRNLWLNPIFTLIFWSRGPKAKRCQKSKKNQIRIVRKPRERLRDTVEMFRKKRKLTRGLINLVNIFWYSSSSAFYNKIAIILVKGRLQAIFFQTAEIVKL